MAEIYRVYTKVNAADTYRDPDEIHIKELGYKSGTDLVREFCEKHIKEHFFKKDTELDETTAGFYATDTCSYGATLVAELIEIDGR